MRKGREEDVKYIDEENNRQCTSISELQRVTCAFPNDVSVIMFFCSLGGTEQGLATLHVHQEHHLEAL